MKVVKLPVKVVELPDNHQVKLLCQNTDLGIWNTIAKYRENNNIKFFKFIFITDEKINQTVLYTKNLIYYIIVKPGLDYPKCLK